MITRLSSLMFVLALTATAMAQSAGMMTGTVTSRPDHGKFFHLKVEKTEPAGVAQPGTTVKIMANWQHVKGKLGPIPADVERIRGYNVGDQLTLAVHKDGKHKGFRFTSENAVKQLNEHDRIRKETMFIPEKPTHVDRSQITGADIDKLLAMEKQIAQTIDVAPGDDVLKTISKAAAMSKQGTAVRLRFAEGRYPIKGKINRPVLTGKAMLVIEGAGPDKTVFDMSGADGNANALFEFNQQHHLIVRGLGFENHPKNAVVFGRYAPIQDNAQVLIEDCRFEKCNIGLIIFHINGLTIRNINSSNHKRTGLFLIAQNAIVQDSIFNGSAGAGPGSFKGGIALAAVDCLIKNVQCDNNKKSASGIRMDHAAENVIVEDTTCNGNGSVGMFWETALGPISIKRSKINDNHGPGMILATVYNIAIDQCEIRRNGKMQFEISAKPRPVIFAKRGIKTGAYAASNLKAGVGKQWTNLRGMMGNRFFTLTNSVIESPKPDVPFFGHKFGKPYIYKTLFTQQYTAHGNTYISPNNSQLFDTFQGEYYKFKLIDLAAWQKWTGQEKGSTWQARQ